MKLRSLVCALALAASAPAMAATFNLGVVGSPTGTNFGNTFSSNQHFVDTYNFTLGSPSAVLAGAVTTFDLNFWRDLSISSVSLVGSSGASSSFNVGPVKMTFSGLLAGAYQLVVTGDVTGTLGTAAYHGSILAIPRVSAPVPEPETLGMLGLGLAAIGFVARRRKQK